MLLLTVYPETIPETDPIDFAKVIDVNLLDTTADLAAAQIIKGIIQKKSRVLIGKRTKMLDAIVRFFPSAYRKYIPTNFRPGRLITQALQRKKVAKEQQKVFIK